MKRKILDIASKVGQGKRVLKMHNSLLGPPSDQDFSIERDISEFKIDEKKGEVLLPLVRGQWRTPSYCQCILSHAFRTRGYKPVVPLCHDDVSLCHRKSPGNEGRSVCDLCNFYGNKMLNKFGIEPLPLSDITIKEHTFNPDDIDEEIEYRGIRVSKFAKASVRKFLRRYTLDLDDEYHWNVYTRALSSAAKHVDICKQIFNKKKIDAVLGFDPVYNISGIYLAMAKSHNIPSYSVSTGYRDGYIMFGRQEENKLPLPQFTNPELIKKNMEEELHKKEINEIENVMKKRTSGSTSTVPYTETGTSIKPKGCDTTVGMFTNLIWDGSLEIETAPFPDVFDWIFTTIDYFIESDMRLIIRTHPVEAIRGTNEDVASSIRENYNNLPENIILVDPEENINSYKLIDDLDVGIVYNSTVGLEMAYNGLPVIIGGDTHYRNLGFTYDPDSPEEYVRFLNKSNRLKSKENTKERARRYCYLLFIQKHIEFPIHSDNGSVSVQLRPVLHDEIRPANKNFDFICERIIKNKPVIRDPATPN